jgi:hypothetical protein
LAIEAQVHKRFLEYRERFAYFSEGDVVPRLTVDEFVAADAEQRELEAKAEARDDEEEVRFAELNRVLFRD